MSNRKSKYVVTSWDGFNRKRRFFDPKTKSEEFTALVATGHAQRLVVGGAVRAEVRSVPEDGVEGDLLGRFERTADGGCLQIGSPRSSKGVKSENETTY